jgi:hypothetical protein
VRIFHTAFNWKTCAETKRSTAPTGLLRSLRPSRLEAFPGKQLTCLVENCWVSAGESRLTGKVRGEPTRPYKLFRGAHHAVVATGELRREDAPRGQNFYTVASRADDTLVDRCAAENIAYAAFFPLSGLGPLHPPC